jgi:hypothetical protein
MKNLSMTGVFKVAASFPPRRIAEVIACAPDAT